MKFKKLSVAALALVTGFATHAQEKKDTTQQKDTVKSFVTFCKDTTGKDSSKTFATITFKDTTQKDTVKSFVAFYKDTTGKDSSKTFAAITFKDTTGKDSSLQTLAMNLNETKLFSSFALLPKNNEAKNESEYANGLKEEEFIL